MSAPFPISKYKVYISEANTYEEAVAEAPDDVEVQEGAQGGFYYEQGSDGSTAAPASSGGDSDSPLTDGVQSPGEYEGYGVDTDGWDNPGVELSEVHEGDLLYVEHPDGNYIAEVDDREAGWSDWEVTFGGGSYHLRPDTTSQPVGLVTETPELGEYQEIEEIDSVAELDPDDIIAWEDAGGFMHYERWEDADASEIGDDFEGKVTNVEPPDPWDNYDMPDPDTTGNDKIEFNRDVATAIEEGDATEVPAYKYMSNAGSIVDEDLAIDAYKSILANDGNKTQRERMERRLRGMDIDPESVRGGGGDGVPPVRQGSVYSNFETDEAVYTAAAVAKSSDELNEWATWNDFFDHLTDEEIEQSFKKFALEDPTNYPFMEQGPLDFEGEEPQYYGNEVGYHDIGGNAGALLSRIEDPDVVHEVINELDEAGADDWDTQQKIAELGATFLKSAGARKEIAKEYDVSHRFAKLNFDSVAGAKWDNEHRAKVFGDIMTESTTQLDTYGLRAALWGYEGEDDEQVNGYNNGRPIGPIEPSPELQEAIEWNQSNAIQKALAEKTDPDGYGLDEQVKDAINDDGTITLYRGVSEKITGHSPSEPWSVQEQTANNFDGAGVMKVEAEADDVLTAFDVNHTNFYSEKEWTLLGGKIADKVEVHEGDPIEAMLKAQFDPDDDGFWIAPNRAWVEAAIHSDMFDEGMFTEYRAVDGEKVPVEEVREREEAIEEASEKIAESAVNRVSKAMEKYRVYVDDPSEVPDGQQVQEGAQGGLYYETEPGDSSTSSGGSSGGDGEDEIDFSSQVSTALEEGDVVDEIAANEWMSNAGQIDDSDLLLEALEPIQDHGTKTARERIRRRLRGLGWDSEEIDDALESNDPEPDDHDEWQEQYSPFDVADQTSLAGSGESTGVNASQMEVHKLEDGTQVYFMEGHDDEPVRRQMATYEVSRLLGGSVPPHASGEFGNGNPWYGAREAGGKDWWEAPYEWKEKVDPEQAAEEFGIQLIAANSDTHGENFSVNEDGELSFFDLDHAGGKIDEKPVEWGDRIYKQWKENVAGVAMKFADNNLEFAEKAEEAARKKAREVIEEDRVDEIVEAVGQHDEDIAENIRYNIELLAEGGEP